MKKTLMGAGLAALAATGVSAAGIERSSNDYGVLFAEGSQLSFGLSFVKPRVSGDYPAALGGGSTGNMANSYTTLSAAYKMDLGEKLSLGLYLNDGYGADASYTQGFYTGLQARWDSNQTAIIGRYAITDRVSVYGGARAVNSSATIAIPDQMIRASTQAAILEQTGQTTVAAADTALANFITLTGDPTGELAQTRALLGATVAAPVGSFQYDADGAGTTDYGYVAGVAYEIPDIALRVALTYESAIEHEFDTTESLPVFGIPGSSQTKVTMPQSVTLDFQTGVAAGTLVFGKIKWTEWSEWEVRTPGYESVTGGNVTGLDNDTISYNLGIGRQFNDRLSGFAQMSYEKANGGIASRLAPTDGSFGLGIGGQYTLDDMKLRAGVQYVKLGDATDGSGVEFSGNSALGFGFQVSFSF
jgi:long-subunit fatty acid transport protein